MVDAGTNHRIRRTKISWGLNETAPVCLAIYKIRPATPAESLSHLYLHGHRTKDDFEVCPDKEQVNYVDQRFQSSTGTNVTPAPQSEVLPMTDEHTSTTKRG